jgi:PPE-repeat protein
MKSSLLVMACVLFAGIGTAVAEPVVLDEVQLEEVTAAGRVPFFGNWNIGVGNTGSYNIGIWNSGFGNIGVGNSGNGNIGINNGFPVFCCDDT